MEGGRVGFATTINKNQWMGWVRPYGLEHMDIELVGEADVNTCTTISVKT